MIRRREDGISCFPVSFDDNRGFHDNFEAQHRLKFLRHRWFHFFRRIRLLWFPLRRFEIFVLSSFWNKVIMEYSTCHLTFATDKEKAIQGLALLVSRSTGMTPWLGLWKETIRSGLSWRGINALPESNSANACKCHVVDGSLWIALLIALLSSCFVELAIKRRTNQLLAWRRCVR